MLEAALGRGQARAVGVSNFDTPDLRWLLGVAKEPVAANECHFAAGMMDDEMIRFAAAANVSLMAYGVLHGTIDPSDPAVAAVAAKHNVSAVGVLLRFVGQHNIALVTASDKRSYDVEDAALFDLTLDADDLAALRALQPGAALVLRLLRKTLPNLHGCGSGRGLPARDCGGVHRVRGQPLGARRPRRVRRRRRRARREGVRDGVSAVGTTLR